MLSRPESETRRPPGQASAGPADPRARGENFKLVAGDKFSPAEQSSMGARIRIGEVSRDLETAKNQYVAMFPPGATRLDRSGAFSYDHVSNPFAIPNRSPAT